MAISSPELAEGPSALDDEAPKEVAGKSPSAIAFARLRKDKVAVVCFVTVALMAVLAIAAPIITGAMHIYWSSEDPRSLDPATYLDFFGDTMPLIGPPHHGFTWSHPLGIAPKNATDNLAYLLYGTRTSLFVATITTVLTTIVGIVVGLVAGYLGGWVDRILMFITDVFLSFPYILGALVLAPIIIAHHKPTDLSGISRSQLEGLIFILTVLTWMGLARLIRGQVLSLREREFIQAAQVMGVPTRRILFKELLPNLVAPIVVATSLSLPAFVTAEAGLSFLGIGLTNYPSLGQMIQAGTSYFQIYPIYLWEPVITITVLVIALNLLGDSVRDAFDPKTRR